MVKKSALIMVDLQNDFCTGGRFEVPNGSEVLPIANQLQGLFDLVVATKDWHPADHVSFASNHAGANVGEVVQLGRVNQVLWPDHCVQNTKGAEFHSGIDVSHVHRIFHKGTNKDVDSYSAFYDNQHMRSTGLAKYLRQENVEDVYLLGLALDYCVKYSALDAKQLGFEVYVIEDACRGIELAEGDIDAALNEMRASGIHTINSGALSPSEAKAS